MEKRLDLILAILRNVRHISLATVNDDGSPHNTPVFAAFGPDLRLYWVSSPASRHSHNIARSGQVFAVAFDSMQSGGGIYLQATARALSEPELTSALTVYNERRKDLLREKLPPEFFNEQGIQKLYCATPQQIWINHSQKDEQGRVIHDERVAVTLADLQKAGW